MAENKAGIIVYADWLSTFEALSDEEAGRLIKHFFLYVNDMNPVAPDRLTALMFEPIKAVLKRDLKKYEQRCKKNAENIGKRWNKENTIVYDRIPTDTKHTDNDNDNDNGIDSKVKEKKENYIIPPTIEMIKKYCTERKNNIDANKFFNFYEAKGWMIGKSKMKDWQAAVRTWEQEKTIISIPKQPEHIR